MAKTKTTYTGQVVIDYVNSYVDNEQKKADSFQLIKLMQEWTDSEKSKMALTELGKFKMTKACIYVKNIRISIYHH